MTLRRGSPGLSGAGPWSKAASEFQGHLLIAPMAHPVRWSILDRCGEKDGMKALRETDGFQEILERKEADLVHILRRRDGIAIEKSADQMDEIQYATERDLAIRNVDRDSNLLRDVKDALRRIHEGGFGICVDCEETISPKRLIAVPWAMRCITCQETADREGQELEDVSETFVNAA